MTTQNQKVFFGDYLIIICFVVFFCYSCRTDLTTKSMAGCYVSKYTNKKLLLRENGTFISLYTHDTYNHKKGDTIGGSFSIINHGRNMIVIPKKSYCKTSPCDTCKYVSIEVVDDKTSEPIELAYIELFDGSNRLDIDSIFTDNNGCFIVSSNNFDSLTVQFIAYYDLQTKVTPYTNHIIVHLVPEHSGWCEKWKIFSKRKIKEDDRFGEIYKRCHCDEVLHPVHRDLQP